MQFTPDQKTVTSASHDHGTLKAWNSETGKLVFDIDSHQRKVQTWLWTTTTHKPFVRVLHNAGGVYTVAFSPNRQHIATGSQEHMIFKWNISQDIILARSLISPSFMIFVPNLTAGLR